MKNAIKIQDSIHNNNNKNERIHRPLRRKLATIETQRSYLAYPKASAYKMLTL